MLSQTALDRVLMASLALNGFFAVAHVVAGLKLFVRGQPYQGDDWIPATPKQRVLLGSYFALSFAWAQVVALMFALLLTGNPLGPWLGVIGLASFAGQWLSMRGNDPVAQAGLSLHLLVLAFWTAGTWLGGRG